MGLAEIITRTIDRFHTGYIARMVPSAMFRYAVCGGMNMVLDLLWYHFIYHTVVAERFINLGFVTVSPHVASLAIVFPITFFNGFWLNRNVAFHATRLASSRQMLRYAFTVVGSLALNYVCIKFFVEICGIWPTPSKALTTAVCVIYSYLAGRYFTFRE